MRTPNTSENETAAALPWILLDPFAGFKNSGGGGRRGARYFCSRVIDLEALS